MTSCATCDSGIYKWLYVSPMCYVVIWVLYSTLFVRLLHSGRLKQFECSEHQAIFLKLQSRKELLIIRPFSRSSFTPMCVQSSGWWLAAISPYIMQLCLFFTTGIEANTDASKVKAGGNFVHNVEIPVTRLDLYFMHPWMTYLSYTVKTMTRQKIITTKN